MDTNVLRAAVAGYANPRSIAQAPDHRARGFATQHPLESETKYNPFEKAYPRFRPSNIMKPLPEFPFGVQPTFNRQEGPVQDFLRQNISMPDIKSNDQTLSADLIEMYAKINAKHRDAPSALSADYQGSPWMYGALYGLPLSHPTNASNFIPEYGAGLSEKEWNRRTQMLVKEGYEPERIHKAMEDHSHEYLKKRLAMR